MDTITIEMRAHDEGDDAWFAVHQDRMFRVRVPLEDEWPEMDIPDGFLIVTWVYRVSPDVSLRLPAWWYPSAAQRSGVEAGNDLAPVSNEFGNDVFTSLIDELGVGDAVKALLGSLGAVN